MFDNFFKAKLNAARQTVKVNKKQGDQHIFSMDLTYEFTEDMAKATDEKAIDIQRMLTNESSNLQMSATTLNLDTESVEVHIKGGCVIKDTIGLSLKASAPNAEDPNPILHVTVSTAMNSKLFSTVDKFLGKPVDIKMLKKQLTLTD